jgi:hypothetical protein
MFYLITSIVLIIVGFIAGIAVGRNNSAKVDSAISEAESLKAKGKALIDALKGK